MPIALLLAVGLIALVAWIVWAVEHPPSHPYLITPEKFAVYSQRGLKTTEATWKNADGTQAQGWLLRGGEGAPAIVLLHGYGADRSWLFNLGVKLNEATNSTVLWPDLRGHGSTPSDGTITFGAREADDATSAISYLRSLKNGQGHTLVGDRIGLYGVELGAYAALLVSSRTTGGIHIKALVLDSVPASPDELLRMTIFKRTNFDNRLLQMLAHNGVRLYTLGRYRNTPACDAAHAINDTRVLLLTGADASYLRDSTNALAPCFSVQTHVQLRNDLPLSGIVIAFATGEQGEAYDRLVIDFFDRALQEDAK